MVTASKRVELHTIRRGFAKPLTTFHNNTTLKVENQSSTHAKEKDFAKNSHAQNR